MDDINASTIEEYFGTLQQSTVETWRKHLKADKNDIHVILNDFYEDIVDLVDTLIEDYMGIYGKVGDYVNNFSEKDVTAIEYLETLRDFTKAGKDKFLKDDELKGDCDDILSLIDTTLYKLKELTDAKDTPQESQLISLKNFLKESLQ